MVLSIAIDLKQGERRRERAPCHNLEATIGRCCVGTEQVLLLVEGGTKIPCSDGREKKTPFVGRFIIFRCHLSHNSHASEVVALVKQPSLNQNEHNIVILLGVLPYPREAQPFSFSVFPSSLPHRHYRSMGLCVLAHTIRFLFLCIYTAPQIGADPYLQKSRAAQCVERTLAEFNDRQLAISNEWESWNSRRRTETTLKEIMAANMEVGV